MRRPAADRESSTSGRLSLLRREQLVRYAVDRLAIEGASRLSPHDRARLAAAAAVLKEICEGWESAATAEPGPCAPHIQPGRRRRSHQTTNRRRWRRTAANS